MAKDVKKESRDEIAENKLLWDEIEPMVRKRAVQWYIAQLENSNSGKLYTMASYCDDGVVCLCLHVCAVLYCVVDGSDRSICCYGYGWFCNNVFIHIILQCTTVSTMIILPTAVVTIIITAPTLCLLV